ncbi:MAG: arylsulfatase A [Verrucomicrobiales bacterium]|jgi:arylsulfatase A
MRPILFSLSLLLSAFSIGHPAGAGEKPNIVIILADDMGYGDVQALNPASMIPTPNLDRLSSAGMSFTDAHTPSAVCTPTRYGLLTGRYCWRTRLKRGVLNGYGKPLISEDRQTVASVLKKAGYATGIVGKWHLGLGFAPGDDGTFDYSKSVDPSPMNYGFEFSHIIPASLDFPPYVYIQNGKVTALPTIEQSAQQFPAFLRKGERATDLVMENCLDDLTAESVKFIRERSTKPQPFLLYFPLTAPHKPVLPHPRYRGKSKLGPYGDFVMQVDDVVGSVLSAVEDAGITGDTVVIFTSDNGSFMHQLEESDHVENSSVQGYRPENHRANYIYRGTKADIWEAGHRVPFLVRWPGKVKNNVKSAKTLCVTDILATCAELAGAELDAETGEDSFSFLGDLMGEAASSPRPAVIHHSSGGMFAIRSGDWKLVAGNGSGGRQNPRGKPFEKPWQLFNLKEDPEEKHNVIEGNAALAKQMGTELERIRKGGYKG